MKTLYTIQVRRSLSLIGRRRYYFRIIHQNGNIICHSETYHNRIDAYRAGLNLLNNLSDYGVIKIID
jgi:hypothetical protein